MKQSTKQPITQDAKKRRLQRAGLVVLILLMVLEGLDYIVAVVTGGAVTTLFVLALINAALIIQYYMHIGELFSEEEHH